MSSPRDSYTPDAGTNKPIFKLSAFLSSPPPTLPQDTTSAASAATLPILKGTRLRDRNNYSPHIERAERRPDVAVDKLMLSAHETFVSLMKSIYCISRRCNLLHGTSRCELAFQYLDHRRNIGLNS